MMMMMMMMVIYMKSNYDDESLMMMTVMTVMTMTMLQYLSKSSRKVESSRPLASHPGAILACLKQWKQNNRNSFAQKLQQYISLHAFAHWQLKVTTSN